MLARNPNQANLKDLVITQFFKRFPILNIILIESQTIVRKAVKKVLEAGTEIEVIPDVSFKPEFDNYLK